VTHRPEDTATPVGQIYLIPAQKFSFSISSLRIEQKIKPIRLLAGLLLLLLYIFENLGDLP
jgi:hypothetical protein